jgi:hypothetical protein
VPNAVLSEMKYLFTVFSTGSHYLVKLLTKVKQTTKAVGTIKVLKTLT